MEPLDLQGRLTLSVPEAGKLLGLGRDASYAAAERGEIECIRVGRRLVVPTHALLRKVGWPDELIAHALGVPLSELVSPPPNGRSMRFTPIEEPVWKPLPFPIPEACLCTWQSQPGRGIARIVACNLCPVHPTPE